LPGENEATSLIVCGKCYGDFQPQRHRSTHKSKNFRPSSAHFIATEAENRRQFLLQLHYITALHLQGIYQFHNMRLPMSMLTPASTLRRLL
jgi:hypothetical protein